MKYSVVVPIFNEAENVGQLHSEIVTAMDAIGDPYEIIFINDGSSDDTAEALQKLSPLVAIHLRKNFGQTAAMDAGIKNAQGEYIITLDGDGQNPPSDIPKLIDAVKEHGYDVVSGWRADRKDPFMKRFVSRGANLLRTVLVSDGIHDSGCSLKIYRKECFKTVDLYGEMHRFIPALLKLKGFTVGEVKVAHRPRVHGVSKYNWKRTVKGLLDMIGVWFWEKYATRPLHLFGGAGFLLISISLIFGIIALYQKLFIGIDLSNTVLTEITFFTLLIGIMLVVFGLMADMLSKLYFGTSKDQSYTIRDVKRQ